MRGNGSKMQAHRRADDRVEITTDAGERVWAAAPVIVSASRATDIPACYTEWFFRRLQRGYAVRRNPFNNTRVPVSFARTRVVVFWSKNPRPLLPRLGELEEREIHSLLHYTLNDYIAEGLEPNLPPLDERIDTFRACAERLGRDRVIWRFDPLLLTDRLDVGELLHRIGHLGDRLSGYTSKLVFSFADIRNYRRVAANLDRAAVRWREFSPVEGHRRLRDLPPRLPLLLREPLAQAGACRIPPPGRGSRQRKSRITDTGTYGESPDAAGAAWGCVVPCGTAGITKRKDRACSRASERPAPHRRRGRTRPIPTPTSRHRAPRGRAAAPSPHG